MATLHDAGQLLLDVSYDSDGCEIALERFRACILEEHNLEAAVLTLNGHTDVDLGERSQEAFIALQDVYVFNKIRNQRI